MERRSIPPGMARILRARAALTGLVMVSGLSVASSALGFVFQVVLAARYGAGATIDSYLFAISVPTFLAGLGVAALSYTIVPALVLVEEDHDARSALLRRLARRLAGVGLIFALAGLPALFLQQWALPPAAGARQIGALPAMILTAWMIAGVQLFTALFTLELNASRRPVIAASLALLPNAGAIVVVLAGPASIVVAPLGVLAGSVAVTVVGALLTRRSFRRPERPVARPAGGEAIPFGRMAWTLGAMTCFSAYGVIDAFWGPRVGDGTLASLGYAQRLVIGLGGLILAGPSAVLTPRFAARLRDGGGRAFLREVTLTLLVVGALAAVSTVVLGLFARPLIGLAFSRGAFRADDVERVATIFRTMLPGFWAMLLSVVVTRALYCLPKIERPMAFVGLSWSVVYFALCGGLRHMGGTGFGISYSLAWLIYIALAVMILRHAARRSIFASVDDRRS